MQKANKDISKAKVSEISAVTYNGREQKPSIILTIDGENVSAENYTLIYKNNLNAGTAQLLINGTGEFTGTQQVTFMFLLLKQWKQLPHRLS